MATKIESLNDSHLISFIVSENSLLQTYRGILLTVLLSCFAMTQFNLVIASFLNIVALLIFRLAHLQKHITDNLQHYFFTNSVFEKETVKLIVTSKLSILCSSDENSSELIFSSRRRLVDVFMRFAYAGSLLNILFTVIVRFFL